jgi:hypothetical protein
MAISVYAFIATCLGALEAKTFIAQRPYKQKKCRSCANDSACFENGSNIKCRTGRAAPAAAAAKPAAATGLSGTSDAVGVMSDLAGHQSAVYVILQPVVQHCACCSM